MNTGKEVGVDDLYVYGSVPDVFAVELEEDSLTQGDVRTIGAVGELYVAACLLCCGYEPYLPLSGRNAESDMLAVHIESGRVVNVQVKSTATNNKRILPPPKETEVGAQVRFIVGGDLRPTYDVKNKQTQVGESVFRIKNYPGLAEKLAESKPKIRK